MFTSRNRYFIYLFDPDSYSRSLRRKDKKMKIYKNMRIEEYENMKNMKEKQENTEGDPASQSLVLQSPLKLGGAVQSNDRGDKRPPQSVQFYNI